MTQTPRKITPYVPTEPVFPLTVDQYHDMIRIGVLSDDDPVELIEGILVFHMPKNPPHAVIVKEVEEAVARLLPAGWCYRTQEPITLADGEPEPDGLVCRGRRRDYLDRHPEPADATIVIEIADTTLSRDRGMKLRSYARAGIATYWIVNLNVRLIEVYTVPASDAVEPTYTDRAEYAEADAVPVVVDGVEVGTIAVRDVLP